MNSSPAAVINRPTLRVDVENAPEAAVSAGTRRIVLSTSGRRHGPITRLVSPSDIGELIKPFVFLDHAEVAPRTEPLFGIHPHSGIATRSRSSFAEASPMRTRPAKRASSRRVDWNG